MVNPISWSLRRSPYLNLQAGFDSAHNRTCIFNASVVPHIQENPRNCKTPKRVRKWFFNAAIDTQRHCVDAAADQHRHRPMPAPQPGSAGANPSPP
jgi:hypothetical protein